jgi:hypothetical protein
VLVEQSRRFAELAWGEVLEMGQTQHRSARRPRAHAWKTLSGKRFPRAL